MPDVMADQLVALLPRLRRFAQSLAGNSDDAADLVQSAVERALKSRVMVEEAVRLDAWMFRIIRNLWIDGLRRRRSEGVHEPLDDWQDLSDIDGRPVIEARLSAREAAQAMGRLPVEQREILRRICVDGQSYKEAASDLGVPVGTVMSRLSRARLRLLAELGLTHEAREGETGR